MVVNAVPVVALDLGGTKFITAVIDADGRRLSRIYSLTQSQDGPKRIIARLKDSIKKAIQRSGIEKSNIGGISIAAAGIIDINNGVITESPNLPRWRNIRLGEILSGEFGMPAVLLNDASAAALGEYHFGAGRGCRNMLYLTVSTGIGGGIIINGELYQGSDGCAAELGHMVIRADGTRCKCGRRGCLEALASGTAIAWMAQEMLRVGCISSLNNLPGISINEITAVDVGNAARKGDIMAVDVINTAANNLGIGLASLTNIFNPDIIVIGGGVSTMGEMFLKPVRRSLKSHAFRLPARRVRVVKSELGADAGLLGAAVYLLQSRSELK